MIVIPATVGTDLKGVYPKTIGTIEPFNYGTTTLPHYLGTRAGSETSLLRLFEDESPNYVGTVDLVVHTLF